MLEKILPLLRCPVSRSPLQLHTISKSLRTFSDGNKEIVYEGILFAAEDWFFPVIMGIPRLGVESFLDYADFLRIHLPDYQERRRQLEQKYPGLISYVTKKNKKTKQSFSLEWSLFNYQEDRTWEGNRAEMMQVFLDETNEKLQSLSGKMIFDAGCGNGLLDELIAQNGAFVLGMDLSNSIERADKQHMHPDAVYIQGDIQFPPVDFSIFDIVHSSGVLTHTNNTELSFCCIERCVKPGGKLSIWIYHPRKDFIHNLFNRFRMLTSKLPAKLQYWLLYLIVFPVSFLIKRIKGNRQNRREMMIAILDWFTPEFRSEHQHDEAASWFHKRDYKSVAVTTSSLFGFSITGIKEKEGKK